MPHIHWQIVTAKILFLDLVIILWNFYNLFNVLNVSISEIFKSNNQNPAQTIDHNKNNSRRFKRMTLSSEHET